MSEISRAGSFNEMSFRLQHSELNLPRRKLDHIICNIKIIIRWFLGLLNLMAMLLQPDESSDANTTDSIPGLESLHFQKML